MDIVVVDLQGHVISFRRDDGWIEEQVAAYAELARFNKPSPA